MNKITIYFTECTPAPSGGYHIFYRVAGTSTLYTNAGYFFVSPAVFYDTDNPQGTCYEGYVQTVCGDVFGNAIPWVSCESGESGSGVICKTYSFSVSGPDDAYWSINAVLCDGTEYNNSGLVGNGSPSEICAQQGTVEVAGYISVSESTLQCGCSEYINNSGDVVNGVDYTDCDGNVFTGQSIADLATVCVRDGTLGGAGSATLTFNGLC